MGTRRKYKIAGPVMIQRLNTFDLLAYLDIIGSVLATLTNASNHFVTNQKYGGIDAKDNIKLLDEIQVHMTNYGDAQKAVSVELNNRLKRDIGVEKTLIEIDKMIMDMGKAHPVLQRDLDELQAEMMAKLKAEEEPLSEPMEDANLKEDAELKKID